MAKGKHKPAPGAIRPDKVLHPQSRKVKKLHGKEVRKQKVSANATAAGQKLQQLGNLIMVHNDRNTKTTIILNSGSFFQLIFDYEFIGEKLLWFHENLDGVQPNVYEETETTTPLTKAMMLELVNAYLARFQDELDQINLKNSIGGDKKNKRHHYRSRVDVIKFTLQNEENDFNGCGLEMPNLLDKNTYEYFTTWTGELRYVQNIEMKRFRRQELEKVESDQAMDAQ